MDDRVDCYSGTEYADRPEKIRREGVWRRITGIRAERRLPDGKQFEVETEGGEKFLLTYAAAQDRWTIRPIP